MKQLLYILFAVTLFTACSSDDDNGEKPTIEEPKSIIGVWESDNYFISFDDNGFYSAYIADQFIDSGNYTKSESVVSCKNSYFNRQTVYAIKNISDTKIDLDISYTDIHGENKKKTMTFTKSGISPASQSNTLAGKSYRTSSSIFGNVTMVFSSYNSGIKSATKGGAEKYPLSFFYIYVGGKLYHQLLIDKSIQVPTIGSWSSDYYTIKCWKLSFDPNGSIDGIENIIL